MEFLIGLLMGTRLLALFGGLQGGSRVEFAPPQLVLSADTVAISCALRNAWPPELLDLLSSGTPLRLYLYVDIREHDAPHALSALMIERVSWYDLVTREYRLLSSDRGDTISFVSRDSAVNATADFRRVGLAPTAALDQRKTYRVSAQAILGKTRVEALHNRAVDLMYYWDFKRPAFRITAIAGRDLLTARPHVEEAPDD